MTSINPIDLAEPMIDFASIADPESGTYTFNGGRRSDSDIDSGSSWDPRSPKGTDTFNGGRPSDKD